MCKVMWRGATEGEQKAAGLIFQSFFGLFCCCWLLRLDSTRVRKDTKKLWKMRDLPLQLVGGVSDLLLDVGEGNGYTGNIDNIKHLCTNVVLEEVKQAR